MTRVRRRIARARLALDLDTELLLDLGPAPRHDTPAERARLAAIWATWAADLMTDPDPDAWAWALRTFGPPR